MTNQLIKLHESLIKKMYAGDFKYNKYCLLYLIVYKLNSYKTLHF